MNKLLIILLLAWSPPSFSVEGGEVGNETLTKDGQTKSTAIAPCKIRENNWEDFVARTKAGKIPELEKFIDMVGRVYFPLRQKIFEVAAQTNFCEVDYDIQKHLPYERRQASADTGAEPPEYAALFDPYAEGDKHLLKIDGRKLYTDKVSTPERAATVVRELIHGFYGERNPRHYELRLHNVIYELHQAYILPEGPKKQEKFELIRDMLKSYSVNISMGRGFFNPRADLVKACKVGLWPCESTFEVLAPRIEVSWSTENVFSQGAKLRRFDFRKKQLSQSELFYSEEAFQTLARLIKVKYKSEIKEENIGMYALGLVYQKPGSVVIKDRFNSDENGDPIVGPKDYAKHFELVKWWLEYIGVYKEAKQAFLDGVTGLLNEGILLEDLHLVREARGFLKLIGEPYYAERRSVLPNSSTGFRWRLPSAKNIIALSKVFSAEEYFADPLLREGFFQVSRNIKGYHGIVHFAPHYFEYIHESLEGDLIARNYGPSKICYMVNNGVKLKRTEAIVQKLRSEWKYRKCINKLEKN